MDRDKLKFSINGCLGAKTPTPDYTKRSGPDNCREPTIKGLVIPQGLQEHPTVRNSRVDISREKII